MAFQGVEETPDALIGALLTWDHYSFMRSWGKSWETFTVSYCKSQSKRGRSRGRGRG